MEILERGINSILDKNSKNQIGIQFSNGIMIPGATPESKNTRIKADIARQAVIVTGQTLTETENSNIDNSDEEGSKDKEGGKDG